MSQDEIKDTEKKKDDEITLRCVLNYPYFFNETNVNFEYKISLPSIPIDFMSKISKTIDENKDDHDKEWYNTLLESQDFYTEAGLYQKRLRDKDSMYYQGVNINEHVKGIEDIKLKKVEGELKGEVAILKLAKHLGIGNVVSIPLPHSGIWVTIKPPTEKELIDFYNSAFSEKIMLGRLTSGLTLTNFSVYVNNKLFDFILDHIQSLNYSDMNIKDLGKYMLIHDFPILAWGFVCSIYPNGFNYQRACTNIEEKCDYISKGIINPFKLLWVDNLSLTEKQKNILYESRPNKFNMNDYNSYILDHKKVRSSLHETSKNIKLKYKIPVFNDYVDEGLSWINKINNIIDSVVVERAEDEEREKQLRLVQLLKSSVLRQFSHFVESIEFDDNFISDRDTICQVLELLSSDDDLRKDITDSILLFKENTTLAMIGIPTFNCPKCNKEQKNDTKDSRFVDVIPLDTMNLFFTLIILKLRKIMERL